MDQPTTLPPAPGPLDGYKKLLAMAVALIAWIAGRWGLDISQADLAGVLTPILVYILAQGRADHGKAAAQIAARAAAPVPDDYVKFPMAESAAPAAPFADKSELPKIKAVASVPDPLPPPPPEEVA
jgi:hypothetical protein